MNTLTTNKKSMWRLAVKKFKHNLFILISCYIWSSATVYATECRKDTNVKSSANIIGNNTLSGGHVAKHVFGEAYAGTESALNKTMFISSAEYYKIQNAYFNTNKTQPALTASVQCPTAGSYDTQELIRVNNFSGGLVAGNVAKCTAVYGGAGTNRNQCKTLGPTFTPISYMMYFIKQGPLGSCVWRLNTMFPRNH